MESGYRLVVEVEALANAAEDNGWTVLATPVDAEVCPEADILQAYQEQNTTGAPRLALDQESRGDRPRVAGEARTDSGLSNADGTGLARLQRDPAPGPSVPTHA